MTTTEQLAMCYVIDRLYRSDAAPIAALAALFTPPGMIVTTDWPVLLGASEEQILDTLTAYYEREVDRLGEDVRGCDTAISRDLSHLLNQWQAECGPERARRQAEQTWQQYAADPAPLIGYVVDGKVRHPSEVTEIRQS